MTNELFLPERGERLGEPDAWRWFNNVSVELEDGFLEGSDRTYLAAYYRRAGLLRSWRRPFFRRHYARALAEAADVLVPGGSVSTVLDLGGGVGTPALLLALIGARVIVLDLDWRALRILRQRTAFYCARARRRLQVYPVCADVFEFPYESIAPFDGVYSMFAFNLMQPSAALLGRICPLIAPGGRLVVQDGNPASWLPRLWPPRRRSALSPEGFERAVRELGLEVVAHRGGPALPPLAWALGPGRVLARLDDALGVSWLMPVSHQIVAARPS